MLSCAYVWPAAWRDFRADPDDAAPAITRALDAQDLEVATLDAGNRRITTGWVALSSGVDRTRERFVVRWERNDKDGTLTIYVRHEAQEQSIGVGGDWGPTYHDGRKEQHLLDAIATELEAPRVALP